MTNKETKEFIKEHKDEDVRKLAFLAKRYPLVDMSYALDQIAGRQKARTKLPLWAEKDDIIFPPHISMEQCSSQLTGSYKAEVMKRWISEAAENTKFYDFTAGFGVDFSFLAPLFSGAVYVEQQAHLCEIAKHNLPLLNLPDAQVLNCDGEELISDLTNSSILSALSAQKAESAELERSFQQSALFAFLDPARRDVKGGRTYAIADCTPNILGFIDKLLALCEVAMVKLSPMLDWHATVKDINNKVSGGDAVREVHVVSTNNECKELLLVLSVKRKTPLKVFCADLPGSSFNFLPRAESSTRDENIFSSRSKFETTWGFDAESAKVLFVPNSSIMKAGCFDVLEETFAVKAISANSHLFLSPITINDFPGRQFKISTISSLNKKELKAALQGIDSANISTRNFPLSPDQLRKRLKLKDGGDIYLFATTTATAEHLIFICEKV